MRLRKRDQWISGKEWRYFLSWMKIFSILLIKKRIYSHTMYPDCIFCSLYFSEPCPSHQTHPPVFLLQKRASLQDLTTKQDKTRYRKTRQKPSYPHQNKGIFIWSYYESKWTIRKKYWLNTALSLLFAEWLLDFMSNILYLNSLVIAFPFSLKKNETKLWLRNILNVKEKDWQEVILHSSNSKSHTLFTFSDMYVFYKKD